jgi:hypothetical protein
VQTHCVVSASLREVFVDLAVDHLNLACVTVGGVPMRRPSQPKFASNLQSVELFFPVLRDHPPSMCVCVCVWLCVCACVCVFVCV